MERSEPTLVPEWLRSTGVVSGAGNSAHHSAAHGSQLAQSARNRFSRNVNDKDTPHSVFVDRSLSASRRNSSSDGSSKHPYSSFSRNNRDKHRDKEKERSVTRDPWDHDGSDPFGDILISKAEKDVLRRSKSLACRKPCDLLPQKPVDPKNRGSKNLNGSNGMLSGGILTSSIQKKAFEKNFPSLGTEEKQGVSDIGRVSSPTLSTAVQCLPNGSQGLIGGEGWTSALAEVPSLIGSNTTSSAPAQQGILVAPSAGVSSPMTALNMAEALSQAPSRAQTTPWLSDKTQRLEELAIKQSRQLIPMTPSMAKGMVLGSDKSKPKITARTSEMTVSTKSVQQHSHSSQVANQSIHVGQIRSDAPRQSHAGKFLVLKPLWENGVSSIPKDVSTPTSSAGQAANGQLATVPVAPPTPSRCPNSSKLPTVERKVAALALNFGSNVDKRSSLSQAQSRSDFFNLMRRKTSTNTSDTITELGAAVSPLNVEKSSKTVKQGSDLVNPSVTDNGREVTGNGIIQLGEKNSFLNGAVDPDEEEAAFLRSLGWEENAEEDDGLTEEEINAFYEEYMKLRPSSKLSQGIQPKLSVLLESHTGGSSRASSELSSSDSETEA